MNAYCTAATYVYTQTEMSGMAYNVLVPNNKNPLFIAVHVSI